ncbi:hypothetical protein TIFTF001_014867 [Ficus carica]|uniref:Uncharacterized protein n=1 Tax=Ficus carica TaxID=3494 RepID=A0AA88A4M2_FICCA|nr:hypothetical protein TIFTF001_014867 [Ficus carica]
MDPPRHDLGPPSLCSHLPQSGFNPLPANPSLPPGLRLDPFPCMTNSGNPSPRSGFKRERKRSGTIWVPPTPAGEPSPPQSWFERERDRVRSETPPPPLATNPALLNQGLRERDPSIWVPPTPAGEPSPFRSKFESPPPKPPPVNPALLDMGRLKQYKLRDNQLGSKMKFLGFVSWLCWILILVLLFNPPFSDHFGRRLLIGCSAGRGDPPFSHRTPPAPKGQIPGFG